jgi:hypothetical protein
MCVLNIYKQKLRLYNTSNIKVYSIKLLGSRIEVDRTGFILTNDKNKKFIFKDENND